MVGPMNIILNHIIKQCYNHDIHVLQFKLQVHNRFTPDQYRINIGAIPDQTLHTKQYILNWLLQIDS